MKIANIWSFLVQKCEPVMIASKRLSGIKTRMTTKWVQQTNVVFIMSAFQSTG